MGIASPEGESSLRPERNWRPWKILSDGKEIADGEEDEEGERLLAEREAPLQLRILCLNRGILAIEIELKRWHEDELTRVGSGGKLKTNDAEL